MSTSPPPHTEAGSDTQNADLDEQRRTSKSNGSGSGLIATGLNMRPYEELTPIYVFKNLVVKPVRYIYTHTLKHPPWLVFHAFGRGWKPQENAVNTPQKHLALWKYGKHEFMQQTYFTAAIFDEM